MTELSHLSNTLNCIFHFRKQIKFLSTQAWEEHVYSQCFYRLDWRFLKISFLFQMFYFFINNSSFIKLATEVCLHNFFLLVDHKSLIKTTLRKLGAGLQSGQTQLEVLEVSSQNLSNYCQQQFIWCSSVCRWLISTSKKHTKNETPLSRCPGYEFNTEISWWLKRQQLDHLQGKSWDNLPVWLTVSESWEALTNGWGDWQLQGGLTDWHHPPQGSAWGKSFSQTGERIYIIVS